MRLIIATLALAAVLLAGCGEASDSVARKEPACPQSHCTQKSLNVFLVDHEWFDHGPNEKRVCPYTEGTMVQYPAISPGGPEQRVYINCLPGQP